MGDSWIAGEHCSQCTTFAGLWAADIEKRTHRPVEVVDFSGHNERSAPHDKTTGSLLWTLQHDPETMNAVARADIVLISTGGNDLPGDAILGGTCGGPDANDCIRSLGTRWHRAYDEILAGILHLRGGRHIAIRLVAAGNPFLADADLRAMVAPKVAMSTGGLIAEVAARAMCEAATTHHAKCLDVRVALTGPHYDKPYDENADSTFRTIAHLLEQAGLPELGLAGPA
jgi:hypothetical protein